MGIVVFALLGCGRGPICTGRTSAWRIAGLAVFWVRTLSTAHGWRATDTGWEASGWDMVDSPPSVRPCMDSRLGTPSPVARSSAKALTRHVSSDDVEKPAVAKGVLSLSIVHSMMANEGLSTERSAKVNKKETHLTAAG